MPNEEKNKVEDQEKLPTVVRVLVGIASLPSLALAFMLLRALFTGNASGIGAFETVYAIVGFVAIYIAITGKKLF
jgi:uncharacterized membrane protein YuzA (DUF378 family)